ncbi:Vacuolar iron transporter-like 4 [Spatholobus suberectus]|nr:Vacuolar iron transporter-like 4 [Spatholobus suberectus]
MASMIIGVGSVEQDTTAMILSGFLVFVAQACSIATGEFMSVSSKLDKKVAPMKREKEKGRSREKEEGHYNEEKESWLNFLQAIAVQALAFAVGGMVPLLATSLIRKYKVGPRVVMATASFALVVSGWLRAVLGKTPVWKSIIMFLVEGWIFMTIPLGLSMFGKVDF